MVRKVVEQIRGADPVPPGDGLKLLFNLLALRFVWLVRVAAEKELSSGIKQVELVAAQNLKAVRHLVGAADRRTETRGSVRPELCYTGAVEARWCGETNYDERGETEMV